MFNLNPKKMQSIMKQMGMSQTEIPASKVIIEKLDEKRIVIDNPSVTKIQIQGQESFQISGEAKEESSMSKEPEISEDDIKTVVEKTGCTEKQAKGVLESNKGDLAETILELNGK